MKAWEFLSHGIPQVCRDGLDLPDHDSIFKYNFYEECLKIIEDITNKKVEIDKESIFNFALKNTWKHRIDNLIEWLKL